MKKFLLLTAFIGLACAVPVILRAQAVIDKIVQNVNGTPITTSDIRQARMLKLVAGGDDGAVQRELENRLLMLSAAANVPPVPASDVEARRRDWAASLGQPVSPDLLARAGMNPGALDEWLRNDLRIQRYIDDRFGGAASGDRDRLVQAWVEDLRKKARIR